MHPLSQIGCYDNLGLEAVGEFKETVVREIDQEFSVAGKPVIPKHSPDLLKIVVLISASLFLERLVSNP